MPRGRQARGFARVAPEVGEHMDLEVLLAKMAEGDDLVRGTALVGAEISDVSARGTSFESVVFRGCVFEGVDLSNCTFTDVLFSGCRLMRCKMERAWLNRVDFRSCSAPGMSFLKGRLTGVSMVDSQFSYCDFSEASVSSLRASSTSLVESNVYSTRLSRVELDGCDLTRSTVFRASLAGVDLSTCDITGIRVSSDFHELRGAIVGEEQAVQLATLLGIRIKEEEAWLS